MVLSLFFTALFISGKFLVNARSAELIKVGTMNNHDVYPDPDEINNEQERTAIQFPKGIVPYFVDSNKYDSLITNRLKAAMDLVEASSCVVFHEMKSKPTKARNTTWVHFTNPAMIRTCIHEPGLGENGELMIIIGFDCMRKRDILHVLLHAIGFKDEVAHPHRDQYIRIVWQNIQPAYRTLFSIIQEDAPHKVVEYDPMSIMHFHDRAFSINGGPTITPKMPGLQIAPSDKLSQLDVMKLRLWFGHECNKRKVGDIFENCKMVFHNNPAHLGGMGIANEDNLSDQSVNVDKEDSFEAWKLDHLPQQEYDPDGGQGPENGGFASEGRQEPDDGKFVPIDDQEVAEGDRHETDETNQGGYQDEGDQNELGEGEGTERRAGVINSKLTTKSKITTKSEISTKSKTTPKNNVTTKSVEIAKGKVTITSKVTAKSEVKSYLH